VLRAFEQGGIFIVPHLLRHGASVFPVSSEGPSHSVASYDTQGDVEKLFLPEFSRVPYQSPLTTQNLFLPGFSRVPYQSPLTTHKGVWRIYSNPDPHGVESVLGINICFQHFKDDNTRTPIHMFASIEGNIVMAALLD
jgi:hypothetical protein